MSDPIPLAIPHLSGKEWVYLKECLDGNAVAAAGSFIGRFEKAVAGYVGAPHAVAVSSGTAALHVALLASGVGPGDAVVVPNFTFVAPVNAVRYCNALPLLVDVDPQSATLDPGSLEGFFNTECERRGEAAVHRVTGKRVRAIVPVHLYGNPANLDALESVARAWGIPLVEDAAECLGARYRGKPVGARAGVACFSFNGNKIITSGSGGMVVTDREDVARRCRHLATQARSHPTEYLHDEVGFNYRMANLNAALGLAQMECLDRYLERKHAIREAYMRGLQGVPGITFLQDPEWGQSSHWLTTLFVDAAVYGMSAAELSSGLRKEGIEGRRLWPPLQHQALFRDCPRQGGAGADRLYDRGLNLPSSVGLEGVGLDRVVEAIRRRAPR